MTRALRALVAAAISLTLVAGSELPAGAAQPRPTVTVSVHPGSTLATAGTAQYAGVVTGVPVGTAVYLEYRDGDGRWFTAAVASTRKHGRFGDTFTSELAGRTVFRAKVHASQKFTSAVSATRKVTMSRFYFLNEVKPASIRSIDTSPVTIGVNTYPHAIVFLATAAAEQESDEQWHLAGRCSLFISTVRYVNAQQAGTGARGDATIFVDAATASTAAVLPGDPGPTMSAPLRNENVVRLRIEFAGKDVLSRIAWLDPRVLCSADPSEH